MPHGRQRALPTEFSFAGFNFPKYLSTIPKGTVQQRKERYKHTGGYYSAPRPGSKGYMCYLDSDFSGPARRWQWCDEVSGARIGHTGWFCDEDCSDNSKIRGIVVRLNKGKGFLIGWSMGEGMATNIETDYIYDDEYSAAQAADDCAKYAAEQEREYQEERNEEFECPDCEQESPRWEIEDNNGKCPHCGEGMVID